MRALTAGRRGGSFRVALTLLLALGLLAQGWLGTVAGGAAAMGTLWGTGALAALACIACVGTLVFTSAAGTPLALAITLSTYPDAAVACLAICVYASQA